MSLFVILCGVKFLNKYFQDNRNKIYSLSYNRSVLTSK